MIDLVWHAVRSDTTAGKAEDIAPKQPEIRGRESGNLVLLPCTALPARLARVVGVLVTEGPATAVLSRAAD